MALARVKTWIAGDVLSAADLNAEFNNILTGSGPTSLISPFTANVNAAGFQLQNAELATLEQLTDNVTTIDNYTSFANAISVIGSTTTTLIINKSTTVSSNQTVPSTLTLWFVGAGQLSISSGVTVTINGPIKASTRRIFSGAGVAAFTSNRSLSSYPVEWWGATGDGTTDDTTALQAALDASRTATDSGRPVIVPPGTYVVTSPLTWTTTTDDVAGLVLIGSGRFTTRFDNRVANDAMLKVQATTASTFPKGGELRNFSIITTTSPATSSGIFIKAHYQLRIENVRINGLTGDGIRVEVASGDADGAIMLDFNRLWISSNTGFGIDVETTGTAIEHSLFRMTNSYITTNVAGGMRWRGLVALIQNTAFLLNRGVGGFQASFPAAASTSRLLEMSSVTLENNEPVCLELQGLTQGHFTNTEFIQNTVPVGSYTACALIGKTAGTATTNVVFRNTFVRVRADANPHTCWDIGTEAQSTHIMGTRWDTYGAAGQTRITNSGVQTHFFDDDKYAFGTASNTDVAAGEITLANGKFYRGNRASGASIGMIRLNAAERVELSDGTVDIQWSKPLVALGGGVAPTLGTIGGSGPATAAQNAWMRVVDSTGAAFWVPAWK